MLVLVTGATGNVGRALARTLRRDGHSVLAAVRSAARARAALGPEVELVDIGDHGAMRAAVERVDAVVNLAGEAIADAPWTAARRRALRDSRVGVTQTLAEHIRSAARPPRVLVSASAIGYYGDRAAHPTHEAAGPTDDFLGALCVAWEQAALACRSERTRVVCLRIGVVLDGEAGALARLLPVFKLGLGGPLGRGDQYFSWIHLDDLLRVIHFALEREALQGPVNATSIRPVTNAELTRALAERLGRRALLRIPAPVLRLALGARAELLLKSQRVLPRKLELAGFRFHYVTLHDALDEILSRQVESAQIERKRGKSSAATADASHVLTQVTELAAPLAEVFPFFSQAQNLAWITPPWMGFGILEPAPTEVREGTIIEYRIKLGPVPLRWRTRIAVFRSGELFVDEQERGPYRLWWHEHHFEQTAHGTRMVDKVFFRVPLGLLGDWLAGPIVRSTLRRIFAYRAQAMAQRFGAHGPRLAFSPRRTPARLAGV